MAVEKQSIVIEQKTGLIPDERENAISKEFVSDQVVQANLEAAKAYDSGEVYYGGTK